MAAAYGQMKCMLFPSAFSGEVVFKVSTASEDYEGIAPKHYVKPDTTPVKEGIEGQVNVRVISNGGDKARVSVPDGQILTVSADIVKQTK